MRMPWDRPISTLTPNRQGDSNSIPIYTNLGRAVSDWEGVAAALGSVFFAILDQETRERPYNLPEEAFGDIKNVNKRADQLLKAWKTFMAPYLEDQKTNNFVVQLDKDLSKILNEVRGWAARRNDLAHGYVTPAQGPDYRKKGLPLTAQYSLCPSHARVGKWHHGEQEYNYLARDIREIAKAFRALDASIEDLAQRIEKLRLDHPL